ncbi:MAG: hypothetical protein II738_02060 [Clostridia bacterium]|nr:hypothetical protein [Clostridia bacterium]
MNTDILVSLITSLATLLGVVLTVYAGGKRTRDILLYRIEQLEKAQQKHNSLIERMYRVEERLELHDEKIKVANHRLDDLETKGDK